MKKLFILSLIVLASCSPKELTEQERWEQHAENTEIIRDDFGLALSSRNNRLTTKQLAQARNFAKLFHQYQLSTSEIKAQLESANIKVEYIKQYQGRCFAAVFIDDVRLIDNWQIPLNQNFQKLDQTDLS